MSSYDPPTSSQWLAASITSSLSLLPCSISNPLLGRSRSYKSQLPDQAQIHPVFLCPSYSYPSPRLSVLYLMSRASNTRGSVGRVRKQRLNLFCRITRPLEVTTCWGSHVGVCSNHSCQDSKFQPWGDGLFY